MQTYKIGEYDIKEVQAVMLDILTVVDELCQKHGIKYILDGGSMLGAVRHGGFIPWDDDLDIAMLREDYEKLMEVCKTELPEEYLWQSAETEPNYPLNFAKIRKKNTVYKERSYKDLDMNQGVYIDVFPIDNTNPEKLPKQLKKLAFLHIVKFTKLKIYKKKKRFLFYPFCLESKKSMDKRAKRLMTQENHTKTDLVYKICHAGKMKPTYPRSIYEDVIRYPFCGKEFYIPADYENFLRGRFGDYMQLPPVDKQQPCHNIVECKL